MGPRTILHTGPGGAGTSTLAAATARRLAAGGARTLLLVIGGSQGIAEPSGDPPPSGLLEVRRLDPRAALERGWAAAAWLADLLARRGADRIAAGELTVPPGAAELFALLELERAFASGAHDAIVVDAGPSTEALRMLAFPETARWWLARALPQRSAQIPAARPLAKLLPDEAALGDVQRALRRLIATNELLRDHERVSVRLVSGPGAAALADAERTATALGLHGILADALIVNGVLPADAGAFLAPRRAADAERIAAARAAFAPLPVLTAPASALEPAGGADLDELAAALGVADLAAVLCDAVPHELVVGARAAELRLALPFARREEVAVQAAGAELLVTVGGQRRAIALPPALADYRAAGAELDAGVLSVRFDREPPAEDDD